MGGVKKRTVSKMSKDASPEMGREKASKKKAKPTMEKKIRSLNITEIKENDLLKEISSLGAITPYKLSSKFDIRLSLAKAILRDLERKKAILREGGNSRLVIYRAAGS